jgi:hypothetical protein
MEHILTLGMTGSVEPSKPWSSGKVKWLKVGQGKILFYYEGHISGDTSFPSFNAYELNHFKQELKLADDDVYNGYNDDFGVQQFSGIKVSI